MNMDVLELRDNAKHQLQEIKTIETGIDYLNKVKAIATWAVAEKKDAELQNIIAEQKIRTQRILGNLLKESDIKRGNIEGSNNREIVKSKDVTLQDYGITKNDSSTFQKIASLPEDIFEAEIAVAKDESKKRIELTTSRIMQAAKDYEKQKQRNESAEKGALKDISVDFRLGDFEDVLSDIPDGSVDCIITDPPYPIEFIECYGKLSKFAKRVLKPNGFCIAYAGHINLPDVLLRMGSYLDYYWIFSMYQPGSTKIVQPTKIMASWKPILIYQKGKKQNSKVIRDHFISEKGEKIGHDWQQSESGVGYLVEMFTNEGDLVIEPFAGSGTTIKVCAEKKRNIIASEIDEQTYNIAKENL